MLYLVVFRKYVVADRFDPLGICFRGIVIHKV